MAALRSLLSRLRSALRPVVDGDEANVKRLAEQLGISLKDSRRLYLLARRDGFGSAYRTVFGDVPPPALASSADDVTGAARTDAGAEPATSAPRA